MIRDFRISFSQFLALAMTILGLAAMPAQAAEIDEDPPAITFFDMGRTYVDTASDNRDFAVSISAQDESGFQYLEFICNTGESNPFSFVLYPTDSGGSVTAWFSSALTTRVPLTNSGTNTSPIWTFSFTFLENRPASDECQWRYQAGDLLGNRGYIGDGRLGKSLTIANSSQEPDSESVSDGQVVGENAAPTADASVRVQFAGSQLVIYSEETTGTFEVFEDGESLGTFTLEESKKAHIIEQRVTGEVTIRRTDTGYIGEEVEFAPTRSLLWYQNYNLGLVSPSFLNSFQRAAVDGLAKSHKSVNGTWKPREQSTSKFICTGIYGPDASAAEKVDARKRAKVACETAQSMNPSTEVSFWFQTKETKALSYVNKVLVTVKGLETFVEESLG
jgi:hypothetical protein